MSVFLLVAGVSMFKRFASFVSKSLPLRTIRRTCDSVSFPSSKKCVFRYSMSALSLCGVGKRVSSSGTVLLASFVPE